MPETRPVVAALLAGVVHAAVLLVVALHLGYGVVLETSSTVELARGVAGLVVVAAVPVWLALRHRVVAPLLALVLTSGYVLGAELAPPGPTFRDVADLERLSEPTGIVVVENGLYVVRYMANASVWTVGFLFVGLLEYAVRDACDRLPPVRTPRWWLSIPATRRRAAAVATVGGLLHAVVMVGFAHRLGVTFAGGSDGWFYAFAAVGMVMLAAIPLYLLVRERLVAPAATLTALLLLDVRAEFTASVDGPHALYFGAWFVFLAVVLAAGAVEYGLRRVGGSRGSGSLA